MPSCYLQTRIVCYEIKTEDFYLDMFNNKNFFDLSEIEANNHMFGRFNDNTNKKVIGIFKPEKVNFVIEEFIGLRSKMYSLLLNDGSEEKRAKGVVKSVVRKELKHETYRNVLQNSGRLHSTMKVIRSNKHQMYTTEMNKVSLSAYDDKRWIKDDGVSSYAYGHYAIPK